MPRLPTASSSSRTATPRRAAACIASATRRPTASSPNTKVHTSRLWRAEATVASRPSNACAPWAWNTVRALRTGGASSMPASSRVAQAGPGTSADGDGRAGPAASMPAARRCGRMNLREPNMRNSGTAAYGNATIASTQPIAAEGCRRCRPMRVAIT